MGKKNGTDYRLWIESATPGTYNEIKGQTGHDVKRQGGLFDTSSKDDGAYGTEMPGQKKVNLDFEIFPNLPDANGYGRLESAALASPSLPVNFQVRKGGSAGVTGDAVFQASMYIGNFDTSYPKDGPVKCTFQLALAAAPTIDALT